MQSRSKGGSDEESHDIDSAALNSYDSRQDINVGRLKQQNTVAEPEFEEKEDFTGKLDNAAKMAKKDALKYYMKA